MNVQQTRLFLYTLRFISNLAKKKISVQSVVFKSDAELITAKFITNDFMHYAINKKIEDDLGINPALPETIQVLFDSWPKLFQTIQKFVSGYSENPFDESPVVKNVKFLAYPDSNFEFYIFDKKTEFIPVGVLHVDEVQPETLGYA